MKKTFSFILMAISFFCASCGNDSNSNVVYAETFSNLQAQKLQKVNARLGETTLKIMLARTNSEKSKGLMYFDTLGEKEGMLFVYSSSQIMSFWMYNTKIPLDLIFFSENLEVTEWVKHMKPGFGIPPTQLPRYISSMPAQYALELNAGSIEKFGIKYGDKLEIPITMLYSE